MSYVKTVAQLRGVKKKSTFINGDFNTILSITGRSRQKSVRI